MYSVYKTGTHPTMPQTQYHTNGKKLELSEFKQMLIPETEYQERYKNRRFNEEMPRINKRFVAAGVTSKGKPECQPEEYDPLDSPVPRFAGESTSKASHGPQPPVSRLPSSKPLPTLADTPTAIPDRHRMKEVQSYSHFVHCPMPAELARETAPVVSLWIREKLRPLQYVPRHDLTSSYQADYCGLRTKPRKICLGKNAAECNWDSEDNCRISEHCTFQCKKTQLDDYVTSLQYCTSNNRNYMPPRTPCLSPKQTTK